MTAKPTAVVVWLPLSDAQVLELLDAYTGDKKTTNPKMEDALLTIGTPVAGGELEVVDYSDYEPKYHDQGMGCGLEDRGITDRYDAMGYGWGEALERVFSDLPETVLLSDAQAALAAAHAEIVRLRDYLETARSYLKEAPSVTARRGALDVIEEALKGPAA